MINNKKPLHQIISEKILSIFYNRINPFTKINFVTNNYSKNDLGLTGLSAFHALKELKKQVNEIIVDTGVTMYKGSSLFDLTAYELKQALPTIKHGIAKQDDFNFSPISKLSNPEYITWIDKKDDIAIKLDSEEPLFKEKARNIAKTEKEFNDLSFNFSYYKNHLYRIVYYSNKITEVINEFGVNEYNGVNLYEITQVDLLREAFSALKLMRYLKEEYHITHYNGTPIERLNLYCLKMIDTNAHENKFEGCTVNKPADTVNEEIAIPEYVQKIWNEKKIEEKKLQAMIKKIVQAELKKANKKIVKKTPEKKVVKRVNTAKEFAK